MYLFFQMNSHTKERIKICAYISISISIFICIYTLFAVKLLPHKYDIMLMFASAFILASSFACGCIYYIVWLSERRHARNRNAGLYDRNNVVPASILVIPRVQQVDNYTQAIVHTDIPKLNSKLTYECNLSDDKDEILIGSDDKNIVIIIQP